ncbi:MAG: hypothetical protein R3E63_02615 [Pseudomonadales bacterium]
MKSWCYQVRHSVASGVVLLLVLLLAGCDGYPSDWSRINKP